MGPPYENYRVRHMLQEEQLIKRRKLLRAERGKPRKSSKEDSQVKARLLSYCPGPIVTAAAYCADATAQSPACALNHMLMLIPDTVWEMLSSTYACAIHSISIRIPPGGLASRQLREGGGLGMYCRSILRRDRAARNLKRRRRNTNRNVGLVHFCKVRHVR